jgi:hypothetical protein
MRTKTAFLFLCVFAGGIERERERERERVPTPYLLILGGMYLRLVIGLCSSSYPSCYAVKDN